jgi:hypothetical protein
MGRENPLSDIDRKAEKAEEPEVEGHVLEKNEKNEEPDVEGHMFDKHEKHEKHEKAE